MKWNKSIVKTPGGFEFEMIIGEWLKPGQYTFGTVEIVEEIADKETIEYFSAEQGIYDMWYNEVMPHDN